MSYYIGGSGYYEGDKVQPDDEEVEQRPSSLHIRQGGEWVLDVEAQKGAIKQQIEAIEKATLMNRAIRELAIGIALEKAIAQGLTQEQLYAANKGFQSVYDVEVQIQGLRVNL